MQSSDQALAHESGTMLVLGAPGSGKTSLLRERYAQLVERGVRSDRILLFVTHAATARKLRNEVVLRLARSLPGVNVLTPRGFARSVIETRYPELGYSEPPEVLNAKDQASFVRELLLSEDPSAWPACGHLLRVRGFVQQIARFVLLLREASIQPDEALKLADSRGHLQEATRFYSRYIEAMDADRKLDAASLVSCAIDVLEQDSAGVFEHVLIDDMQDASRQMTRLLAAIRPRSVVAAADPEGATRPERCEALEAFPRENVVVLRVPAVFESTLRALDSAYSLPLDSPSKNVQARLFAHPGEEADAIAHELASAHADGIAWGEMAVILRRYTSNVSPIRHALDRHHIPFVAGATGFRLVEEPAVEPLITALRFIASPDGRDALLDRVLCSPMIGLTPSDVRVLRRQARIESASAIEVALAENTMLRIMVAEIEPLRDDGVEAFWSLYARAPYVQKLIDTQSHHDLDALVAVSKALELDERITISELLQLVEQIPAPGAIDRYPNAVKLLSVRDARARSFEIAIVANCVEGEFPSAQPHRLLIDAEDLIAPKPDIERVRQSFASERRLFRCAITRARSKTFVFASRNASSTNPKTPSRYVEQRLGLSWENPDSTEHAEATSKRIAQAELRRIARDPGSSRIEQLAALEALRRTGEDPSTWWGVNDWTDTKTAMFAADQPVKTSYTKISAMNNCGLQYLYQVELGLDPEQSYQMWVGSTVHEIIDRAQKQEVALTEEALHATLDDLWEPSQFPNLAIEHRRYLDCKRMLSAWLHEESGTPVVKSEVEFEYAIDGATMRGKIDAIKRMNNGKLRIIDYKTGTYAPTKNDVKKDLQLASYYLATKKVEELAAFGEPGALQLAYIAKPSWETEITLLGVTPKEVEPWAENKLVELTQLVRNERFAPNPDADCQWCKFKQLCPIWPEGSEPITREES